jgi:hypothetical protein
MEVDGKKTKFVIVSRKPYSENEYVKTVTFNFEILNDCTYLGTILTNKNELRPGVGERIRNTGRALCTSSIITHSRKNKIL